MLKKLEHLIKSRNIKLTEPRLAVLKLLSANREAKTAYELLAQYRKKNPSGQAMTIYRALDYFMKQHLVHKITSQNAYQLCTEEHDDLINAILVCTLCHNSTEVPVKSTVIIKITQAHHFKITEPAMEITGICQDCQ